MTREDVLREVRGRNGKCRCWECVSELLAEEVLGLRAKLQAARERVKVLPALNFHVETEGSRVLWSAMVSGTAENPGIYLDRDDVLAALGKDE